MNFKINFTGSNPPTKVWGIWERDKSIILAIRSFTKLRRKITLSPKWAVSREFETAQSNINGSSQRGLESQFSHFASSTCSIFSSICYYYCYHHHHWPPLQQWLSKRVLNAQGCLLTSLLPIVHFPLLGPAFAAHLFCLLIGEWRSGDSFSSSVEPCNVTRL